MRSAAIFLIGGLALAGCNRNAGSSVAPKPPVAIGTAAITGLVKFIGTPPAVSDIPNAVCAGTQRTIPDETIQVTPGGGLGNCLVYLQATPAGDGSVVRPVVLDQVSCQYVPHVLALMVGQALVIKSSDATPHNVHLQTQINPPANYAMVQPGQQAVTHFAYPEIFKVSCDVHPWMTAWVGVFANPFFAVTDARGQFNIRDVPAGAYTLIVWQERLGEQQKTIQIADHQSLQENFSYAPSAAGAGG